MRHVALKRQASDETDKAKGGQRPASQETCHEPPRPQGTVILITFCAAGAEMVGFALGRLLQGVFFGPQDPVHLGVNALSLMVPMIAVHETFGKRLFAAGTADRFSFARVLGIDAVYHAGVAAMVGFWLITFATVTVMKSWRNAGALQRFTELGRLSFA
jgi:hypothetical protein